MRNLLVFVVVFGTCLAIGDALAVMSIDFGSEFLKIAIVKPGVPMEVAYNSESKRKTNVVVSLRNGERLFSDPAMSVAVRFPDKAYQYLQDLLAKSLDNPVVKRYQERFPYYKLVEDPETKNVLFQHSEEETLSPEELIGMVLEHAKLIASNFAEQPVTDAVITVPAYFSQAERRAMVRAADLAGIKLLQLMNDNTATALQYGIFRRKEFNTTAVNYMFFDMGSTSTTATVVSYSEVKEKNKITGTLDKFPQLQVRGVGFDRNLGGLEFQLRLRDHLAKLFNSQKKTDQDVFQNKRSMAKLFKEAGRLKHVLSANADHLSQVESLLDDQDFRAKVTRAELENMCADLYERIDRVVKDALQSSEFTMDEISEVILMGGGTRMPKVQEYLQKATGREELGKSINTDEAAALGAVYQAAHLSKGFKVKKFGIKEATVFPIVIEFERAKLPSGEEPEKKMVTRTLFGRNNAYPQKKVMTFNKHTNDFDFVVNYGDLSFMDQEHLDSFGSRELHKVSLTGVAEAYGTHKDDADSKGVKAHFKMEESGILSLDQVEFVFERQPIAVENDKEQSTLEKIGSAFGSLFGGSDKEKPETDSSVEDSEAKSKKETESAKETDDTKIDGKESESKKHSTEESSDDKAEKQEQKKTIKEDEPQEQEKNSDEEQEKSDKEDTGKEEETKDESKKEDKESEADSKDEKKKENEKYDTKADKKEKKDKDSEKKVEKPKNVTLKVDVGHSTVILDKPEPSKDSLKASKKKLQDLKKKDEEKALLEKAKNDLESFVIDTQQKLYEDDYIASSLESDREDYISKLSAASDWIYEVDEDTGKEAYIEKLTELKKMTKDLFERVYERQERPRAKEALRSILNYSEHFLVSMKNFTGSEPGEQPFTQVEYDTLSKLINTTKEWNETMSEEQAKAPDTEKPKMTIEDFARKIGELDREVKYLVNKAKAFRPKAPPKTDEKKNSTKSKSNDTKSDNVTESDEKIAVDDENIEAAAEDKGSEEFTPENLPVEDPGAAKSRKKRIEPEEGEPEEVLQLDGEDGAINEQDSKQENTNQDSHTEETATHNPEL